MKSRNDLGRRGEQAAANYLSNQGWKIIGHNLHLGKKEIDLIAIKNGRITLFEIKTRSSLDTNHPISTRQRATLRQAHQEYCELKNLNPDNVDYNLIIINYFKGQANLEYFSNFL